jgi:hypothetical protein
MTIKPTHKLVFSHDYVHMPKVVGTPVEIFERNGSRYIRFEDEGLMFERLVSDFFVKNHLVPLK